MTYADTNPLRDELERQLLDHVGVAPQDASAADMMSGVAQLAREQLSQRWVATQAAERGNRRVYYLSMEFLMGRTLGNALAALDLQDGAAAALASRAQRLEDIEQHEADAALGNGGLGRLAACFLDSMATLGLPSFGYGIRYEYGMFAQTIQTAGRSSTPTPGSATARRGNFRAAACTIRCASAAGWNTPATRPSGARPATVDAKAYDMVVPGHGTERVSTLRLWKAAAPEHIDLHAFNSGDYARAAEVKNEFENISWVLYPNDSTPAGRELRLRQEYFFVSASIQDIVDAPPAGTRHARLNLADKVAIHLNDTHPAIGVAELMRAAVRRTRAALGRRLGADAAGLQLHQPHADARGAGDLAGGADAAVLPRHLEIILRINQEFLDFAAACRPGDDRVPARGCR